MNYQMLKLIIEMVLKTFSCPECWSKISEKDIEIVWISWSGVNLEISCPNCKKHTLIKSQVAQVPFFNKDIWEWAFKKQSIITDKEVVNLSKILKKKNLNADELFGG